MSPAKVISGNSSFIVPENEELHMVAGFDSLKDQERKDLTYTHIVGTPDGYMISSDTQKAETITEHSLFPMNRPPSGSKWEMLEGKPVLILSMGTRIEPVENKLTSEQTPSLKEK